MFRYLILIGAVAIVAGSAFAQAPDILWSRTFGGGEYEEGYWIEETSDSGFIAVGRTGPYGGPFDCYIVKMTADGDTSWTATQGGAERDEAWGVCQTADGGYLVGGFSMSYPPNGFDFHLMKFTAGGTEDWHKEYGGVDTAEYLTTMCQTADGNYVLAGGDSQSESDFYLVKVNSGGTEIWSKRLDLPGVPGPNGIAPTTDSGFIVAAGPGVYLVRFSAAGDTLWRRTYTGGSTNGNSVVELADGGFAVLGTRDFGVTHEDFWLLRLDPNGDTLWTRHYGNSDPDDGYCVRSTYDGGFILVGNHYPPGEDRNFYVVRTNSTGDTLWTKSIGGDKGEYAYCVQPTADTGYVIVGRTNSFGAGYNDMFVVKLGPDRVSPAGIWDEDAQVPADYTLSQNFPNPFNAGTEISFALPQAARVRLEVFNIVGRRVALLHDGRLGPGGHTVRWDAGRVGSGVYFYRLQAGDFVSARKMLLLK